MSWMEFGGAVFLLHSASRTTRRCIFGLSMKIYKTGSIFDNLCWMVIVWLVLEISSTHQE
jgi:hypothetical protein